MYRILIVEDDAVIAGAVQRQMEGWGLEARCVTDFRGVMEAFRDYAPHLVLLDLVLPVRSGYHWCQEIRKISNVPVIFLSSASDNMNIVMAMNMGGDDFIAKPFDGNVLTAHVQALLRRCYNYVAPQPVYRSRGAVLDTADASLTVNGNRMELTRNDYKILLTLMEQSGKVVSRETLMNRLWESDSFVDENTLTVNIARLRRKLEQAGLPDFIVTRKGLGYLIGE